MASRVPEFDQQAFDFMRRIVDAPPVKLIPRFRALVTSVRRLLRSRGEVATVCAIGQRAIVYWWEW